MSISSRECPTYLLLYVDDMLIAARNKTHVQKLKAQLKKKFDMKNLREVRKLRYGDHLRQKYKQILIISGELCSQSVREI